MSLPPPFQRRLCPVQLEPSRDLFSSTVLASNPFKVQEEQLLIRRHQSICAIKILEQHAGTLTNFEVLYLLRSRGAGKDPTRVIASVLPSEFKVFDYLEQTPACSQTREILEESKKFDLAKAEIVNIINIRPSSAVEVYTIIKECDSRMEERVDDLVEIITYFATSSISSGV